MPIITAIEPQKRNADRSNVYIDNEFFMGASNYIVGKHLKVGKEVDIDFLAEICIEDSLEKAKEYFLNYLVGRPSKIVRDKLKDKGYDEVVINKLIEFGLNYNFINDFDYAKRFTHDYLFIKQYGKQYIKRKLSYEKGIKEDDISLAFKEFSYDDEYEVAQKRFEKALSKYQHKAKDKWDLRRKISNNLYGRGFPSDMINELLQNL